MAEAEAGEERIADLQRQWQESPTPRVGLQLAEEHRRLERHAEARTVLERSLEAHPGHLSSLVALGKTLLDLGEPGAAAEHFQRVVERDPTHLVAGKLLIEANLRRGDGEAARERLELYRLLNEADPEIEELGRRLRELEIHGSPASGPSAPAPPGPPSPPPVVHTGGPADDSPRPEVSTASAEPGTGSEAAPVGEVTAPAVPGIPGDAEWSLVDEPAAGGTVEPQAALEPTAHPARLEHGAGEPFGALAAEGDERRWLAGLGDDGIFAVELPPEPEPRPEAATEPEAETQPEAESQPEPAPAPVRQAEAISDREEEAAQSARSPLPEPAAPATDPPPGEQRATNTLGELYLAQGHLADAERVFRAVLARRLEDPAARAGLAEVARRRASPLTAGELLDWARGRGDRVPTGGDRREQSSVLLRSYLARLRRRSATDVS